MKRTGKIGAASTTLLVTLVTLFAVSAAQAQSVIFDMGDATKVTDIIGLDVGGSLYDVEFVVFDTGQNVYGGAFEFPTSIEAVAAANSVSTLFNSLPTVPVTVGPSGGSASTFFDIAYNEDGSLYDFHRTAYNTPDPDQTWQVNASSAQLSSNFNNAWAKFTPSAVPEPGTFVVMGFGFAALCLIRRKGKSRV